MSRRRRRPGASIRSVVLYHAAGCHLCEAARATMTRLREELGFDLREVDIGGDPALEARYREYLPVVEIDDERAFVYFVPEDGFRRRFARTKSPISDAF